MAFNIVDLVKDQISDQLLGRMGNVLGTDGSKTSAALGSALPGLLSGLTGAASHPHGADALFDTVRRQDDALLGKLDTLLGGGDDTSRLIEQGNVTLGSLLGGDALDKLGSVLASFVGLSRSGSGSLLGMLAPIVLGALKRKVGESGLDAGGLATLLDEQRSNVGAAMPQGLVGQLQSEGFFDSIAPQVDSAPPAPAPTPAAPPPTAPAATATTPAASTTPAAHAPSASPATPAGGGGAMRWLLPIAAVVVLGLLAWMFLGGDAEEAVDAAGPGGAAATDAATGSFDVELPEGVDLDRITGEVSNVVAKTAETLDGVTDEASARAALPALRDINTRLGGLNDVVTRLPEAARAPVAEAVGTGLGRLRPIADRVLGMPAVGPVVEPVLRPILDTMEGLAG